VYERKPRSVDEEPFRVQQYLQEDARRRTALARERAGVTFSPERGEQDTRAQRSALDASADESRARSGGRR
jgi:hypothetical protein